ncbi:META domain-containing protein [Shimia abyssi]|uniref:Heat shock protein HslJ n=1 Tax=Shimia abyssi TaxID=1662395 RepID=A0A2P8F822_9RHOB|nr:META domain-containing protein [Shimia abyssi]PSL17870.1 heat shock protein HslJ [Shimia abyssi]
MRLILFIALLPLAACLRDETVTQYGGADYDWTLQQVDGVPTNVRLTLQLQPGGTVQGTGPCNAFAAQQTAPYPWFVLEAFSTTEMACTPDEATVFADLQAMSLVEVSGDRLILSTDDGREMVFSAADDG